jgi:hypothetical protein
MTFLVSDHGHIYEKDLGSRTAAVASGMTSFDPDDTWRRVTRAFSPRRTPLRSERQAPMSADGTSRRWSYVGFRRGAAVRWRLGVKHLQCPVSGDSSFVSASQRRE